MYNIESATRYWKHWRKGYLTAQLSLQYGNDDGLNEAPANDPNMWIDMMRSGYYEAVAEIKAITKLIQQENTL